MTGLSRRALVGGPEGPPPPGPTRLTELLQVDEVPHAHHEVGHAGEAVRPEAGEQVPARRHVDAPGPDTSGRDHAKAVAPVKLEGRLTVRTGLDPLRHLVAGGGALTCWSSMKCGWSARFSVLSQPEAGNVVGRVPNP
jgi:hypothetical protein